MVEPSFVGSIPATSTNFYGKPETFSKIIR